MKAITAIKTNTGCPWAGGEEVTVELSEIKAIGKLSIYGSFVINYVVMTTDERLYFINVSKIKTGLLGTPAEAKAIQKAVKNLVAPNPSREVGWATRWQEVQF